MTNLFDALEFCLQEMERGADLESVLARFPEHADELRPILKTAEKARSMASAEPSPEVIRRSRSRVLQHAAELRESKVAPRRRSVISPLQRFVLGFAMLAFLLLSTNGLLSASASALPGEQLYPVKRGWESIRLFFIFDSEARKLLEDEFENERLHEVNELLAEGRHEVIEFAGVFMQVNGVSYISGLQVILPAGMTVPANGDAVIVSGRTNAQGFIEIISLQLLPAGSIVPTGNPVEMEIESESDSDEEATPPAVPSAGSGNEAVESTPQELEVKGTLQAISTTELIINGMKVFLDNSKIEGQLCVGMEVEVKGYYGADGRFIVLEAKGKGECSGGAILGTNSNTNSDDGNLNDNSSDDNTDSGDDDNSNSDDDSNDNDSNDDDSSGGDDSNDDSSGSSSNDND